MASVIDLFKNPTDVELDLAARFAGLPESPQRTRNFEAFAASGLPTRRKEAWKWSDVRAALKTIVEETSAPVDKTPFSSIDDAITMIWSAKGLEVPTSLPDGLRVIQQDKGNALGGAEDLPMAALGAALSDKPGAALIEVTKPIDQAIHLVLKADAPAHFGRLSFVLRDEASIHVMESHLGGGGFSSLVVEYGLQDNAALTRSIFQNATDGGVHTVTGLVHLNAGAKLNQTHLGFGSRLARLETRVFHHGPEAHAELNGAYLLSDGRHLDQTSHVRHSRSDCSTTQSIKGAVLDGGRAVFQGKFEVARDAQKTDAKMEHNALILEDGGEVNAKPELEIYADDVQCAHGNTVGALDQEALFYLRQRGIPEKDARRILTEAFIAEAFGSAPEPVREALEQEAREWLTASL